MIYKINVEKKQEFIKWNFNQTLKNQLPITIPGFIIMDIIMLILFPIKYQKIASFIPFIILGANMIFIPVSLFSIFLGVKKVAKTIESWELELNDGFAVLKNSIATTTVNYADFKKFKKDTDSITFYLNGLRRFYINWNCFLDSEKLKSELEQTAQKIGTFNKDNLSPDEQKTKVKIKAKSKLTIYIILMIILVIFQVILRML